MIKVFTSVNELSEYAADLFIESAEQAIKERGRFAVSLAGGSTPMRLYKILSGKKMEWNKIHFFWGDERCVPIQDEESNYGQVKKILLDKINAKKEHVHRVKTELEPRLAAIDYAQTVGDFSQPLDLALLGMGDDAHTASLFPNSPVYEASPAIAVTADYQGRPANRVTLTPMVFNAAKRVVFLVSGKSKAQAIFNIFGKERDLLRFPAQRITPINGELIWLLDDDAADLIKNSGLF